MLTHPLHVSDVQETTGVAVLLHTTHTLQNMYLTIEGKISNINEDKTTLDTHIGLQSSATIFCQSKVHLYSVMTINICTYVSPIENLYV